MSVRTMTVASEPSGTIPAFQNMPGYPYPLLPNGVYPCDDALLKQAFVDPFPGSKTREDIYTGFQALRREVAALNIPLTHWVDGSFVEGKLDPEDIDVVTFCDGAAILALSDPDAKRLEALLSEEERAGDEYESHSFFVRVWPKLDPRRQHYERVRKYWRNYWGHNREYDKRTGKRYTVNSKGFVVMTTGQPSACPEISDL